MRFTVTYVFVFTAGYLLATCVARWQWYRQLREEIERFVDRHSEKLKETDKAFEQSQQQEGGGV